MRMKKRYLLGFLTACLWGTGMLSADCRIGYIEVCVQVAWSDTPLSGSFLSAGREYTDELGY